jgi:hypothetical protein
VNVKTVSSLRLVQGLIRIKNDEANRVAFFVSKIHVARSVKSAKADGRGRIGFSKNAFVKAMSNQTASAWCEFWFGQITGCAEATIATVLDN